MMLIERFGSKIIRLRNSRGTKCNLSGINILKISWASVHYWNKKWGKYSNRPTLQPCLTVAMEAACLQSAAEAVSPCGHDEGRGSRSRSEGRAPRSHELLWPPRRSCTSRPRALAATAKAAHLAAGLHRGSRSPDMQLPNARRGTAQATVWDSSIGL